MKKKKKLNGQATSTTGPPSFSSLLSTLETTQGQIYSFFSQLPFKCYLPEVASVGD